VNISREHWKKRGPAHVLHNTLK